MQSVALDMLEVMVRSSSPPLGDPLMNVAFPAVVQRTLNTDDLSTLQNGGECLRAYVSVAPEQVRPSSASFDLVTTFLLKENRGKIKVVLDETVLLIFLCRNLQLKLVVNQKMRDSLFAAHVCFWGDLLRSSQSLT